MKDYLKLIEEADSLTRMVVNSLKKKKYGNEFLTNLVLLSLEKYMVGYLMSKGNLPSGHTLSFLVSQITCYTALPGDVVDRIEWIDKKTQLCSFSYTEIYIPSDAEMQDIVSSLRFIQDVVKEELIFAV